MEQNLFLHKESDSFLAKRQGGLDYVPDKIALSYSDFKFIEDSEYYRTFQATSKTHKRVDTIRVLNVDSIFYQSNPNLAATLFVQEFLRLCATSPQAALIETFEINANKIAYAIRHCQTLQHLLNKKAIIKDLNIEYLLADVLSDVSFLLSTLKLSNKINIELQSINYIHSTSSFILSDWGKNSLKKDYAGPELDRDKQISDGSEEVYLLGEKVLEFLGLSKKEVKELEVLKNGSMYIGALDSVLSDLKLPAESSSKLKKTLIRDPNLRMKLGEFTRDQVSKKPDMFSSYGTRINDLLSNKPAFQPKLEQFIPKEEMHRLDLSEKIIKDFAESFLQTGGNFNGRGGGNLNGRGGGNFMGGRGSISKPV